MSKIKQLTTVAALLAGTVLVTTSFMSGCDTGSTTTKPDTIATVTPLPFAPIAPDFNADTAYRFIEQQLSYGPRIPGTPAHAACAAWMSAQFAQYGAAVTVQDGQMTGKDGKPVNFKNVIASYKPEATGRVMLTAHWDSRPVADKDATKPTLAVPGANDGASGVAIILEVARQFGIKAPNIGIDLILWDAEDNGDYNNNESWCLGSQYWAKHPHKAGYKARYGINLDMVGAQDARYTKDGYSIANARIETDNVWSIAAQLGYGLYFSGAVNDFASVDDHYFVMQGSGIPMVEVIHRDVNSGEFFPHWHRTTDDINSIDKATLKATGQTMLEVLYREN
jgi:glutaminyl-peptide cyclotransferase